jgi:SAM-dependent methyltransferase
MDERRIESEKQAIVDRYGAWTAHNIELAPGLHTMRTGVVHDEYRLRRIAQVISDVTREPFHRLRILDLACLEGLFAVELARQGARVVAVEGREASIEKARFAQRVLSLDRLQLVHDDVRNVSRREYGEFDVVLALGILYHLDAPDVFDFIERVAELCSRAAIFDTHFALQSPDVFLHAGRKYYGGRFDEPIGSDPHDSEVLWSAVGNARSVILTQESLYNALQHAGFTTVAGCYVPPVEELANWGTFIAVKGERVRLRVAPLLNDEPWTDLKESLSPSLVGNGRGPSSSAQLRKLLAARAWGILRWSGRRLPPPMRRRARLAMARLARRR